MCRLARLPISRILSKSVSLDIGHILFCMPPCMTAAIPAAQHVTEMRVCLNMQKVELHTGKDTRTLQVMESKLSTGAPPLLTPHPCPVRRQPCLRLRSCRAAQPLGPPLHLLGFC